MQDPDALYITLFYKIAQHGLNNDHSAAPVIHYPGEWTSFIFQNGTQRNYSNIAVVVGNFDGVVDGKSFYSKFCTGLNGVSTLSTLPPPPLSLNNQSTTTPSGYPLPVIVHSQGVVAGYYLNGMGLDDVAVLSIPSFSPQPSSSPQVSETTGQGFESVTQNFLATAKAAGKTKLVVDLQGNGGGLLSLGYDAFLQLFPNVIPYGASQYRAYNGLKLIGQESTISSET